MSRQSIVLAAVAKWEPVTGYQILKLFEEYSELLTWDSDHTTLYRTLRLLMDKEFITSKDSISDKKNIPQIEYRITDLGYSRLAEWLSEPYEAGITIGNTVTRLFFSGLLPKDKQIELLLVWREAIKSREVINYPEKFNQLLEQLVYMDTNHLIGWCDKMVELIEAQ